jgi:type III pantothenate kinase
MHGSSAHLLGVCVGNTRTRYAVFQGPELQDSASVVNADPGALALALAEVYSAAGSPTVVMASVNRPTADRLEADLVDQTGAAIFRVGRDLEVPIAHALRDGSTVGQDRLLCALGAFSRARQACVVIDAGTAVTVDFVDGEGTFQGGAIAPGLAMMLRALSEGTAALPLVRYEPPAPGEGPFGKDTAGAMRAGVRAAVVGMVHELVDRYAESFGAYPQVVATGGDAHTLLADDPIVEHLVPDLQLIGLHAACVAALGGAPADEGGE